MQATDARHPNPALEAKLAHLFTLRGGPVIDLTIRPAYMELLARLGNPHKKLLPVIHVAGTNGKGSVIAFMRAVLETAGYAVHVYTSPHLKKFNERIVLAGREIDDSSLEFLLDEVTAANKGLPLTFFEITTAMAFLAFSRVPADIALLETGLGGRLDSTNVVENPITTAITSIGRDHMEFLGSTIQEIAGEKAGIMKRGVPCVTAPQTHPEPEPVLIQRARELSVPIQRFGYEWQCGSDGSRMNFRYGSDSYDLPLPALTGAHQIRNAGTALAALMSVRDRFQVTEKSMAGGLQTAFWPGRLQKIYDPFLSSGWELWIDGGHNEDAAQVLAAQAQDWSRRDGRPLYLAVGMMRRKDVAAFLAPMAPHAAAIYGMPVAPGDPLAHDRESFMSALAGSGLKVFWEEAPARIINHITGSGPPGRILITGSLYLMKEFSGSARAG
ncbi:MAG: bifunctional folylpolyglutamate synthase/dihydrofolate synthase [Proteobacteria bacterium]|nr:bifunctional folylpolyglutamate synthase/dihydrofolate synthase [Pseudomonadota bacterium]